MPFFCPKNNGEGTKRVSGKSSREKGNRKMAASKGEMEDQISRALTQWEKEYLGRGSIAVKTDIIRNIILVQLKGILTPAEKNLAMTKEGLLSVKRIRSDLIESGSEQLKEIILRITGKDVISMYTDISTRTGERVIVFLLRDNLEEEFQK
jgi:uncharacterized protein YbcI